MLFKPEMIERSLVPHPVTGVLKDVTRRLKKPMEKVGGIYKARRGMYSKVHYFKYRNLGMREVLLWDITEEEAKREGFTSKEDFFFVFYDINKGKVDPVMNFTIWRVEYELVDICPGCENNLGDALCTKDGRNHDFEYYHNGINNIIGVKSCSEFKLREIV